jgi:hypothetical protein
MANVSFVDGDGVKRYVEVTGAGTTASPYIFTFMTPSGQTIPISFDANTAIKIRDDATTNRLAIDSTGRITVRFVDEIAAVNPTVTSGIIGLFRGLWSAIGFSSEASDSVGSISAKLRFLIVDTIGTTSSIVDVAGTLMGRLRAIAQSYASPNVFTRFGSSAGDTISGTPARVTKIYVYNKATSIRFFQLFDRTSNPTNGATPRISIAVGAGERLFLGIAQLGSNDGLSFPTGLAWGFSTTEATYTAGVTTEISIEILWRSL